MKALLVALFAVTALTTSVASAAPIKAYDAATKGVAMTPALTATEDAGSEPADDPSSVPPMMPAPVPTTQLLTAIGIATLFLWRLQAAHRPVRRKGAMHW